MINPGLEKPVDKSDAFGHPLQPLADQFFGGWADDHCNEPGKTGIKLSRVPDRTHIAQDVETAFLPISQSTPSEQVLPTVRAIVSAAFESVENTSNLARSISEATAFENNPTLLLEAMDALRRQGKNIGILFIHQELMDIPIGMACLGLAADDPSSLEHNVVLTSKTMAYEGLAKFGGAPAVDVMSQFCSQVFVAPRTDSAKDRSIPEKLLAAVNGKAGRALHSLKRKGCYMGVALSGTSLKPKKDDDGNIVGYKMETIGKESAGLLNGLDYLLQIVIAKDPRTGEYQWYISKLEKNEVKDKTKKTRELIELANEQQQLLAKEFENLTGLPVSYEPLADSEIGGEESDLIGKAALNGTIAR